MRQQAGTEAGATSRLALLLSNHLINETAAYPFCNASGRFWSGRRALVRWPLRGLDDTISLSPISWHDQDLGIVARLASFRRRAMPFFSCEHTYTSGVEHSIPALARFCKPPAITTGLFESQEPGD
jgi:hypothetical protein